VSGVLEAIRERRSVRAYRPGQPADAVILRLLEAAVHAPTAMHAEPWGFVVVQDRAALGRYSERAKAMLLGPAEMAVGWGSVAAPHPEHRARLADPAFNVFYDAGTLIVVCRRGDGAFADADCWLAAQNLMLAATAEGLGSCCIGFALPALNTADLKRELGIPAEGAAVAAVIVGTARDAAPPVPRKPPQVLRWLR
jgi:nitroreductase